MGSDTRDIRLRAIEWHVRLRDGGDADWDAFATWLAADARHAAAYDRIEQIDLAIEPLRDDLIFREAANDDNSGSDIVPDPPAGRSRWYWFAGGAIAASLAAAVIMPQSGSGRYEVVTKAGERRIITLDTATQVTLNGSTRMTFDRDDPRFASLASGEALFRVRHDSAHPFRLEVGDDRVEDVGTIFNVVRDQSEVRVAVAEGIVVYNPGGQAIRLKTGQTLVAAGSGRSVQIYQVPAASVGTWQEGRLIYSRAPLARVAADLGRSLGIRITVSPSIANRLFSGTIMIAPSGRAPLGEIGAALNVRLEPDRDGWTMRPGSSAGR